MFGHIDRKKSTKAYFLCKDYGSFGANPVVGKAMSS